jgi:hypothetical protein
MTAKKDLKKRVRARQALTGEPYTAALQSILFKQNPLVTELADVSLLAQEHGIVARVNATHTLAKDGEVQADERAFLHTALRTLSALLREKLTDPKLGKLARALLLGQVPAFDSTARQTHLLSFLRDLGAGLRGVSQDGAALAFSVEHEGRRIDLVVHFFGPLPNGVPRVLLSTVHDDWLKLRTYISAIL